MNDNAEAHNRNASKNDTGLLDDKREREDWIKRQESAVGGKLQNMTRKAIVLAIADKGKSPTAALEGIKERYFEGDEKHPDAQIISRIIESIHSKVPLSAVAEIENNKAEAFREKLRESLPASNRVVKNIENIFDHVKDGYKSGLIPDLYELQTEVDELVSILGLDKNIFSGAITKYSLLVPKFEEKY
ncbi:MAG: hypothetical protein GWP15_00625 [Nitrospirae bacterium]|nr:hypothetical protein [Nitrospirota bacterium]